MRCTTTPARRGSSRTIPKVGYRLIAPVLPRPPSRCRPPPSPARRPGEGGRSRARSRRRGPLADPRISTHGPRRRRARAPRRPAGARGTVFVRSHARSGAAVFAGWPLRGVRRRTRSACARSSSAKSQPGNADIRRSRRPSTFRRCIFRTANASRSPAHRRRRMRDSRARPRHTGNPAAGRLRAAAPRRFDLSPDASGSCTLPRCARPAGRLVVRDLRSGEDRTLTTPEPEMGDDLQPRFSPDGAQIVFFRGAQSHREIWIVNADDPASVRNAQSPRGYPTARPGSVGKGRCWSPRTGSASAA